MEDESGQNGASTRLGNIEFMTRVHMATGTIKPVKNGARDR